MPFTLCHPAIVIALHRYASQVTSLPALVIGSMAPDFVYFFPLFAGGTFTHSPAGVLLYCVPAALLVYLVYFMLIRQPLLAWLPPAISARMKVETLWQMRNWKSLLIVLGSLATGAATHLAWDSFTHANTVVVNRYSLLRSVITVGGHDVPLFKLLQHASSLLGFVVITSCLLAWFKRTSPAAPPSGMRPPSLTTHARVWTLAWVTAAALLGGVAGWWCRHAHSIERGIFNLIVTAMAATALAILLACAAWHVNARRLAPRN